MSNLISMETRVIWVGLYQRFCQRQGTRSLFFFFSGHLGHESHLLENFVEKWDHFAARCYLQPPIVQKPCVLCTKFSDPPFLSFFANWSNQISGTTHETQGRFHGEMKHL